MSARAHSTFGQGSLGARRAIPRTLSTWAASPRACRTLVPTFPVAPTTTTRISGALPALEHVNLAAVDVALRGEELADPIDDELGAFVRQEMPGAGDKLHRHVVGVT